MRDHVISRGRLTHNISNYRSENWKMSIKVAFQRVILFNGDIYLISIRICFTHKIGDNRTGVTQNIVFC